MFYYDPRYRLSSGSAPAVGTMTVRANPDRRCRGEAHLAAITAAGNLVLFHRNYDKLSGIRTEQPPIFMDAGEDSGAVLASVNTSPCMASV